MKTLSESVAEYNEGKLRFHGPKIRINDLKDALLKVYRTCGLDASQSILTYFKVTRVEDISEADYDVFIEMCERELLSI